MANLTLKNLEKARVFRTQSKNARITVKNGEGRNKMVQRNDKQRCVYCEDQRSHIKLCFRRNWRSLFMRVIENSLVRGASAILNREAQ